MGLCVFVTKPNVLQSVGDPRLRRLTIMAIFVVLYPLARLFAVSAGRRAPAWRKLLQRTSFSSLEDRNLILRKKVQFVIVYELGFSLLSNLLTLRLNDQLSFALSAIAGPLADATPRLVKAWLVTRSVKVAPEDGSEDVVVAIGDSKDPADQRLLYGEPHFSELRADASRQSRTNTEPPLPSDCRHPTTTIDPGPPTSAPSKSTVGISAPPAPPQNSPSTQSPLGRSHRLSPRQKLAWDLVGAKCTDSAARLAAAAAALSLGGASPPWAACGGWVRPLPELVTRCAALLAAGAAVDVAEVAAARWVVGAEAVGDAAAAVAARDVRLGSATTWIVALTPAYVLGVVVAIDAWLLGDGGTDCYASGRKALF
ncbi:hypothetical protein HK405_005429 [Cladochytrium tenue]|nr:hypothetical protein HK405_005429 [Cladochytrium tenue]